MKIFRWLIIVLFALGLGIALLLPMMPEDPRDFLRIMIPTAPLKSETFMDDTFITHYLLIFFNIVFLCDSFLANSISKKIVNIFIKMQRDTGAAKNNSILIFMLFLTGIVPLAIGILSEHINLNKIYMQSIVLFLTTSLSLWRLQILLSRGASRHQRYVDKIEEEKKDD